MNELTACPDAVRHSGQPIGLPDLVAWLFPEVKGRNLIGLEIEFGLVRPASGMSVAYDEARGGKDLLEELLKVMGGLPIFEGPALVGVVLPDGAKFTLEMGGAIEYSSYPEESLTACLAQATSRVVAAARIAERMGIGLLTGGLLPFDSPHRITWVPKPRTRLMREHFRSLGEGGRYGDAVMGLTLSTQVSLDAATPVEYVEKLRALVAVSPFLAAFLTNTPSLREPAGCEASIRMRYWRQIDPQRCHRLTARLLAISDLEELVALLASLPMIYRRDGASYLPTPGYPFRDALVRGYPDGALPRLADWDTHLSQLWPSVRPRRTLETRLPDGPAWAGIPALPAFFVGLVEEASARRRALDLVADLSPDLLDEITVAVARSGLCGLPPLVREVGLQLVRLARDGLADRAARGVEAPSMVRSLDQVVEVAEAGGTFAGRMLREWNSSWRRSPRRYVQAMTVPTS